MSNLPPNGPLPQADVPVFAQAASQPNIDLIQVIWRWKWLTVLGACIGACVGYLVYLRTPPEYQAGATIQVVSPKDDLIPLKSIDGGFVNASRADEIRVITSSRIVRNAVDSGRLTQSPKLAGKQADEIVAWIRSGKKLTVTPGTKDQQTSIIDISFKCHDAELAAEVVKAIVDGYAQHLREQYKNDGAEIVTQISRAKDEYEKNFREISDKHAKFRRNSKLIWSGDDGENPYRNALTVIGERRQQNQIKIRTIESALERVDRARQNGQENAEVMLLALSELLNRYTHPDARLEQRQNIDYLSKAEMSAADIFERDRVLPLRIQLNTILTTSGEAHPSVRLLQNEIATYESIAAEMREKERIHREKFEEKLKEMAVAPESKENQLNVVIGALQTQMELLRVEDDKLRIDYEAQFKNSQEIESSMVDYKVLLQELNNTSSFLKQLEDALAKFGLNPEYGQKKMLQLDISSLGGLSGPFASRYMLVAAFLGGLLFSGLAYLLEIVDRSFRSPEEIANELAVPILAHVPLADISAADRKDDKVDLSVVAVHRSKSSQSEAYRGVRTGLYFNNRNGEHKVIQVTSPVPGDGKSTTAANLAVTMAQSGKKTLLLDADFRRPRVSKLFGTKDDVGMTAVIAGTSELVDVIQQSSVENLSILACGKRPSNPSELLSSDRFEELLSMLKEKFDYVIIDSPPLLAVSDPANVAARVDGVVLTLRLRRNLKPLALRAVQMLHSVNANLIGVVVNGVGGQGGYGAGGYRYGSSYGYGYGRYDYGYGRPGYGYGTSQQYGYGYGGTYGYGYGGSYGIKSYYEDDKKDQKRGKRRPVTKPVEKPPTA